MLTLREWPMTLSTVLDEGKQDTFIYRNFQIRHNYEGWYVCNHSDFKKPYPRLSTLIEDLNRYKSNAATRVLLLRRQKMQACVNG